MPAYLAQRVLLKIPVHRLLNFIGRNLVILNLVHLVNDIPLVGRSPINCDFIDAFYFGQLWHQDILRILLNVKSTGAGVNGIGENGAFLIAGSAQVDVGVADPGRKIGVNLPDQVGHLEAGHIQFLMFIKMQFDAS